MFLRFAQATSINSGGTGRILESMWLILSVMSIKMRSFLNIIINLVDVFPPLCNYAVRFVGYDVTAGERVGWCFSLWSVCCSCPLVCLEAPNHLQQWRHVAAVAIVNMKSLLKVWSPLPSAQSLATDPPRPPAPHPWPPHTPSDCSLSTHVLYSVSICCRADDSETWCGDVWGLSRGTRRR